MAARGGRPPLPEPPLFPGCSGRLPTPRNPHPTTAISWGPRVRRIPSGLEVTLGDLGKTDSYTRAEPSFPLGSSFPNTVGGEER